MAITVRLNFAEPPAIAAGLARVVGITDLGNTQKMAEKPGNRNYVINIDPMKHCDPDGRLKSLDTLIEESKTEEEREAFCQLKVADHIELLGHGSPGSDAIYSNPCQNRVGENGTNWFGTTPYKMADVGKFLADCEGSPDINMISCYGASKVDGQSMCTRLRDALNEHAKGKATGNITGYTESCGVDHDGTVAISQSTVDSVRNSWWAQIPIIGPLLVAIVAVIKFVVDLVRSILSFLTGGLIGSGSDKWTKEIKDATVTDRKGPQSQYRSAPTDTSGLKSSASTEPSEIRPWQSTRAASASGRDASANPSSPCTCSDVRAEVSELRDSQRGKSAPKDPTIPTNTTRRPL